MAAGIWNTLFGVAFVVGGLSGKFTLVFTKSPEALVVVGLIMAGVGVSQIIRSRRGQAQ